MAASSKLSRPKPAGPTPPLPPPYPPGASVSNRSASTPPGATAKIDPTRVRRPRARPPAAWTAGRAKVELIVRGRFRRRASRRHLRCSERRDGDGSVLNEHVAKVALDVDTTGGRAPARRQRDELARCATDDEVVEVEIPREAARRWASGGTSQDHCPSRDRSWPPHQLREERHERALHRLRPRRPGSSPAFRAIVERTDMAREVDDVDGVAVWVGGDRLWSRRCITRSVPPENRGRRYSSPSRLIGKVGLGPLSRGTQGATAGRRRARSVPGPAWPTARLQRRRDHLVRAATRKRRRRTRR